MNREPAFSIGADVPFNRVSPKYGLKEVLATMIITVPLLIVAVVLAVVFTAEAPWLHAVWAAVLVYGVVATIIIVRQARAIGYAERSDDLLLGCGMMFHRATFVPYGRVQFVDVDACPFDPMFGLATVRLHTASAATDASTPGLPMAEADRLCDSLAGLGRANMAGL